ncbi:MAG: alpha/beta fold hydrolase [Myxococcota bacterium]
MREVTWDVRGLTMAGLAWGEGEGVPTVMVHGWLDHAGSWTKTAERLKGRVYAVDLRGHGRSAWIGPGQTYHIPEYVADLDAIVSQLGGKVRLVGHSLGGAVVTYYAGARPERVQRLAVVDGLGIPDGGPDARDRMVQFLDGVARQRGGSRPLPNVDAAAERLLTIYPFLDPGWARALATRGTRKDEKGVAWAYDPRHLLRAAHPYRQDAHMRFLEAIQCPVLVVVPDGTPFAEEDRSRLLASIPRVRTLKIEGCGHMVPLQKPEILGDALAGFMEDPEGGAA